MRTIPVELKTDELHITSVIIQHRAEAAAALAACIGEMAPAVELAIPGDHRSIVVCEGDSQHAIVERLDALREIPGVLNVTLVYHHAEPRDALDVSISAPGVPATGVHA
jgi:nitrate reductase NapD